MLIPFRLPTDIQAESIPLILGGGDVLMVRCLSISSAESVPLWGSTEIFNFSSVCMLYHCLCFVYRQLRLEVEKLE